MNESEKEVEKNPVLEIGLGIEPPPLDEIDNLHSPPNSPGLVLSGIKTTTNEKIDFLALDTGESNEYNTSDFPTAKNLEFDPSSVYMTSSGSTRQRRLPPAANSKDDVDLNLFASSDSYFSRVRKSSDLSGKRLSKPKIRRTSDVSDKSEGIRSFASYGGSEAGSLGSYNSESETELTASPSAKYVRRRDRRSRINDDDTTSEFSSLTDFGAFDEIIHNGSLNNRFENSSYTSGMQSRSSSRPRTGSKDKDDRERSKDGSTTSQIFKNMLILEESLRQQYTQQQSLRLKYSLFLVFCSLLFVSSTYTTSYNSIYTSNLNNSYNDTTFDEIMSKSTIICETKHSLQTTIEDSTVCKNPTGFSSFSNLDSDLNINAKDCPNRNTSDYQSSVIDESGYVLKNLVYRVVSIVTGMTLLLFFVTGEYMRTISQPRKFITTANKGIRQLNVKLVKVKNPFKDQLMGYFNQMNFFRRATLQTISKTGVDHVRLVLNPRVFSTATREQWELYRNQFWNLESDRRLRQKKAET